MTFLPNSSCHPFTITLDPTPSLDVFPYLSQILSCLLHFSLGVPSCRHLYSLIDSIHAFRIKQSWKTGVWKPILHICGRKTAMFTCTWKTGRFLHTWLERVLPDYEFIWFTVRFDSPKNNSLHYLPWRPVHHCFREINHRPILTWLAKEPSQSI